MGQLENKYDIVVSQPASIENKLFDPGKIIPDLERVLTKVLKRGILTGHQSAPDFDESKIQGVSWYILFLNGNPDVSATNLKFAGKFKHILKIFLDKDIEEPDEIKQYPGFPFNINAPDDYWMNIVNMAYEIKKTNRTEKHPGIVQKPQNKVFFTYVTQNELIYKNLIASELLKHDYAEAPVSGDKDNMPASDSLLKSSGAYISILPREESLSEIELNTIFEQLSLISEQAKNKKHFIWMPADMHYSEHKLFNEIKAKGFIDRSEVVQAPIEVFKSLLIKRLTEQEINKDSFLQENPDLVYILHDQQDSNISLLASELKKQGKKVVSSGEVIKSKNPVMEHRNTLLKTGTVIIHYPENNNPWLQSKFHDLVKSPGYGKQKPFRAKFLLTKEPSTISQENLISGIDILTYRSAIDQELIVKLSQKIT